MSPPHLPAPDTGTGRACPPAPPCTASLLPPGVWGCSGKRGGTGLLVGDTAEGLSPDPFCPTGELSLALGSGVTAKPGTSDFLEFCIPFLHSHFPKFPLLPCGSLWCGWGHHQGWLVTPLSHTRCWGDAGGSHRVCSWGCLAFGPPANKRVVGNSAQQSCDCVGHQGGGCGCHSSGGAGGSSLSQRDQCLEHRDSPASK